MAVVAYGGAWLVAVLLSACSPDATKRPLFDLLSPDSTGIKFRNDLPEDTAFNILNYLYYYNGGGVAAGDVNNDGLPDLYFTSNLGSNRLYLNRGDFRFEDVTARAGVAVPVGWKSGVTMADVNGDGHLDIYVSAVRYLAMQGRNVLFINNGDGTFTDRTRELGLEHEGYSTQAAFFDYDADGDLDMYLLNSSVHTERGPSSAPQRKRHPRAGDRLFRNDGGRFVDVSERAGIHGGVEGYGLGVVASDLNLDGCIDIYVANDFQENDFLYYNNCDGTFTESIAKAMPHTSRFSMGVDAADFNNDLRPDVVVLDMLPEREEILKTTASAESADLFDAKLRAGYHAQYSRNTLQLNQGDGRFSDIGYLAGVAATDWSWAPLFADFDNDGDKDLFVTNGIYRRPNDLDYIQLVGQPPVQASLERGITHDNLRLLERMPSVPLPNYVYRNNGDLTFTNLADAWGASQAGFSNGAAYVDLDNDGALDLVVNNVNAPAAIYRNRARELNDNHFLKVVLRGPASNLAGIGAKLVVTHDGQTQMFEVMPTRGFQSSVDPRPHFGLGRSTRIDSLTVIWPDRRFQTLTNLRADGLYAFSYGGAIERVAPKATPAPLFDDITRVSGIDFTHRENDFVEYGREPLIPHLVSTEGPALAVGDVNADLLDDLYVGGGKGQPGQLFVQRADGRFRVSPVSDFISDSAHEDVDAAFFDADGDGDQDLVVASGGNELVGPHDALRDRLYVNDGRGGFARKRDAFPDIFENKSCVAPGDFDNDGDVDLFVGGRVVPRAYGVSPRSHLLQNDGTGRFLDVTAAKSEGLATAGMVTSAAWLDIDGDRRQELVVVGEWMPVRVFRQVNGRFVDRTTDAGLARTTGWWNSVTAFDLNGGGHQDLALGNLGLNSALRASRQAPARLYVHDFGADGRVESILTTYKNGVSFPVAGRDELLAAMPFLSGRFPTYASFGAATLESIFPKEELARARVLEAEQFSSAIAMNDGRGRFTLTVLPTEAQFAPVYAALAEDFDGDGRRDLLLGGNFYGVTPARGRYDASPALLLRGLGDGRFTLAGGGESGLRIEGQVRALAVLRRPGGGRLIAIARNNDSLQILRVK